jgi:hypothetical protein
MRVSQKSKFAVFCWTTNVRKGGISGAAYNSKLQTNSLNITQIYKLRYTSSPL